MKAALATGLPTGTFGGATASIVAGRKRREADADAEADANAYYYSSVSGHGRAYSTFVDDHPVVAYSHPFGYSYGLPYGHNYGLYYNHAAAPRGPQPQPQTQSQSKKNPSM